MADFALWSAACETALWPANTVARAYRANPQAILENVIEADPVAACVRDLMTTRAREVSFFAQGHKIDDLIDLHDCLFAYGAAKNATVTRPNISGPRRGIGS